jgi:hypothetical protein
VLLQLLSSLQVLLLPPCLLGCLAVSAFDCLQPAQQQSLLLLLQWSNQQLLCS